ncbi:DUF3551 domain-containing protein [Bradyrhizobium australafricanum]|uniref:DUF3551 domain-containing protein n=1 Tax=Bradyrhizobium australafricanum TaxID=2821406 RepID=UPI002899DFE9|nr:DUF3551 domain-containing protein [Bradyrhizobium australafricanum]MCA6101042.1 DUF3551 domain-containing protein [Bradyrhizobium australafricanum]
MELRGNYRSFAPLEQSGIRTEESPMRVSLFVYCVDVWDRGVRNCSRAQCLASASGQNVTCRLNPRAAFGEQRRQYRDRHR